MSDVVFLDGEWLPRDRARVPIDDRGFLFGDAVYEVIRAVRGRFVEADRHLRRLARSLREIALPAPGLDLLSVATDLIGRNGLGQGEAVVYAQVSRGTAPRQHAFPVPPVRPTVLVTVTPFTPRAELVEGGVSVITEADLRWSRCDIKSVNLLANVLASQRASERDAFEAVLVRDGVVTEATRSNVFGVVSGVLRTHPTGPLILPGVTREVVLELAREAGVSLREEALRVPELTAAEEVFLTGTTADVMPVVTLDGRPVGTGKPGLVTRRMAALLAERLRLGSPVR